LGIKVEGTCLSVVEELFLDGKPDLLSGVASLTNGVLEVDGNGAEQPPEDDDVRPLSAG
jgi:hypothetical protein